MARKRNGKTARRVAMTMGSITLACSLAVPAALADEAASPSPETPASAATEEPAPQPEPQPAEEGTAETQEPPAAETPEPPAAPAGQEGDAAPAEPQAPEDPAPGGAQEGAGAVEGSPSGEGAPGTGEEGAQGEPEGPAEEAPAPEDPGQPAAPDDPVDGEGSGEEALPDEGEPAGDGDADTGQAADENGQAGAEGAEKPDQPAEDGGDRDDASGAEPDQDGEGDAADDAEKEDGKEDEADGAETEAVDEAADLEDMLAASDSAALTRSPSTTASVSANGSTVTLRASGGAFDKAWGVSFEVSGSRGTVWVAATRQSDGSWLAYASSSSVGSGSVSVTGWANVASDPAAAVSSTTVRIPGVEASLSLSYDASSGSIVARASGVSCPSGVTFVSVGITSPAGTERWYRLSQQADGSWSASIDPADFGWQSGTYALVGSICDAAWAGIDAGSTHAKLEFGSESFSAKTAGDGSSLSLVASGGRFDAAWGVSFEVVGSRGTQWIPAVRQSDGSWKADVASGTVGAGSVRVTAWANIGSSPAASISSASAEIPGVEASLSLSYDASSGSIVARASGVSCPSGVTFVSVGITSPAGTERWYRLSQQADGSWSASIDPADFGWQSGTYALVGSICDAAWAGIDAGSTHAKLEFGGEKISASVSSDGKTVVVTTSGGRYAQSWNVSLEVSSASKTIWVAAAKQSDGSWVARVDSEDLGGGLLTICAYANVGSQTLRLDSTQVRTHSATPSVTCVVQATQDNILTTASGGAFARATNVAFAVYNVSEGTSQTAWFQAYKQSDGSWATEIPAEVNGVGTCIVGAYATYDGTTSQLATTRYTYSVVPQLTTEIYLGGGDYSVSYGMAGLKVQRIQQALGIGDYNYPRYLDQTVAAVKSFQSRAGLPVTGVVDRSTWLALGLSEYEWTTLGAYASPVRVSATASASERVEAMISRAYDYLGDSYVWDASGAPGQGVDCAGLVMQALYAAGLDTGIINPVTHSTTSWGDHDALNFYYYGGFTKVSLADRVRGDLIFYGNGTIDHVAIYLGNDQIIEAYPNKVQTNTLWKATILGVTRVFS